MTFRRCTAYDATTPPRTSDAGGPASRDVDQPGSRFNTGDARARRSSRRRSASRSRTRTGDDESNARQYDVDRKALRGRGRPHVAATSADSGDRDAARGARAGDDGRDPARAGRRSGSPARCCRSRSTEFDHPLGPRALRGHLHRLHPRLQPARRAVHDDARRPGGRRRRGRRGDGDGNGGPGPGGPPPAAAPEGAAPAPAPAPLGRRRAAADAPGRRCASRSGFRSTGVTPVNGRRGLRLAFARRTGRP